MQANRSASKTGDTLPAKLLICGLLVAMADWLFYGEPVGWTAGLYGLLLTAALCLLHRNLLKQVSGRIVAVLLAGLVLAMVENPGTLQVAAFCAGVAALLVLPKRDGISDAALFIKDMLKLAFRIPVQWLRDRRVARKAGTKKKLLARPLLMPVLYRILPPVLLAGVFCALFSRANPVIERLIAQFGWQIDVEDMFVPSRWFFWWLAGMAAWALLRPRSRPSKPAIADRMNLDRWIDKGSLIGSLLLFNLIFAIQNGLDLAFLWNGEGKALPEGLTLADYAHAGAYPLIATALLAGAYVLVTFDDQRRHYQTAAARWLVAAWVAQNIFLVISSIDRTLLYIEIYSLTYLRVAALVWMGLVALGLLFIVARIFLQRSNTWLVNVNMLSLAIVLYACCFVNFDRMIANYNVRHAAEITGTGTGSVLDIAYLGEIGTEAIPALNWYAINAPHSPARDEAMSVARNLSNELTDETKHNWRSWTWRRQRAEDNYITQVKK